MQPSAVVGDQKPQPLIGDTRVHVDPPGVRAVGSDVGMDHHVGQGLGRCQANPLNLLPGASGRDGKRGYGVPRLRYRGGHSCVRLAQTFQVIDAHLALVEYPDRGESKRQ